MSYQQYSGRRGYSCPCSSCQNRSGETWTRRNWNSCGCNDTANYARNTCGCNDTANFTRSTCGCASTANTTRSTCGCANTANTTRANDEDCHKNERNRSDRTGCSCQNQGIEWRNRGTCNTCGAARNISCPLNPCATGAADNGVLSGESLAMVYSPFQNFEELYDPREGLCSGTIFNGLNKPFCPKCGC